MVFPKIVDHVFVDLLNFFRGQFGKDVHDVAVVFLGVPELFGLLFCMREKVFCLVEESIGQVKLFVLQLLHFDYLFGAFGVLGTGVGGEEVFEFGA